MTVLIFGCALVFAGMHVREILEFLDRQNAST